MNSSAIKFAIKRGIDFLVDRQQPNGEFPTYISTHPEMLSLTADSTLMSTLAVLGSVKYLKSEFADNVMERGCRFLMAEMEKPGLWRYWTASAGVDIDYDLDDTCLASHILSSSKLSIQIPNVDLVLARRDTNGLFRTWFRSSQSRNDIDSVVNANVLLYVGDRPETRNASQFLNDIIINKKNRRSSQYYPNEASLYHAISRSYQQGASSLVTSVDSILGEIYSQQNSDGSFGDPLETAQNCCTLINFEQSSQPQLAKALEYVTLRQLDDGSWPLTCFWTGPEPPNPVSLYWGAREITTAVCLECLSRFRDLS